MKHKTITVIDETIREGMQHQGVVFTHSQRKKILDFQEVLGVDICQAGYPPAHTFESEAVKILYHHAKKQGYDIRIAGMGRAFSADTATLIKTGINDFHLHAHISPDAGERKKAKTFSAIAETVKQLKQLRRGAVVSLAMLDIGKTDPDLFCETARYLLETLKIDILSLPDTSGMMGPNLFYERIKPVAGMAESLKANISVHCHNDMGMASANSVMGVVAGATVLEASALGIGERNGLADLFTTCLTLKNQGFSLKLNTDDIETFKAYYNYISGICFDQTGRNLMTHNTPFFGDAVKTHVAGTHGNSDFGIAKEELFYLNVLCGKSLVKNYLRALNISFDPNALSAITEKIKSDSARLGRRLEPNEVTIIAAKFN